MDVTHILENLNDQQREAVTSEQQNIMVLAWCWVWENSGISA